MEALIHPTAIISNKAQLGANVRVGAYSIIEDDVQIGDNTEIRSSVVIGKGTVIGSDNRICASTVIGTEPQDLKYAGEPTTVQIGDRNVIREFVTINRATTATNVTIVGSDNLIMAYCHIAHDCRVGNKIIMSNTSQLAGHVSIQDWAILGAFTKVHQFCRVGEHCMVGADVKAVKDIPPFTLVGREPAKVEGINKVGLKRRGFANSVIFALDDFYKTLIHSGLNNSDAIAKVLESGEPCAEVRRCIDFIQASERGVYRS